MKTNFPTYLNFDLQIVPVRNAYRIQVLDAPAGRPSVDFKNPFTPTKFEAFMQQIQGLTLSVATGEPAFLKESGEALYNALFHGEVLACLQGSLGKAKAQNANLRIRLRLDDAPELVSLPWEYLYDPVRNRFLTLAHETVLTYFPALPDSPKVIAITKPLRILTIVANPVDLQLLSAEQEWTNLQTALAGLTATGQVQLHRLPVATIQSLQEALRRADYHILHFIGHGKFDEARAVGLLFFGNEAQQAHPVTASDLSMVLHNATVHLAVLNACEGALTAQQQPFAGVAQSLVQQGMPAVIAMQQALSDRAAQTFSHEFYKALAAGYPMESALTEARVAIRLAQGGVEWGTPRLYMNTSQEGLGALTRWIAEDGGTEADEQTMCEPRPQFDPAFLRELDAPGGAVKLRDKLYIERTDDSILREQLLKWGSTTTIRAPRQTGKTSLLMRGIHFAGQQGIESIFIDLQSFDQEQLLSLDLFLRHFASGICEELEVDHTLLDTAWRGSLGAPQKLTRFLAKQILPLFDKPVVLAIDEADKLLQTSFAQSFFALIRHWQSRQVSHPDPWEKLNIVMVISTEPNLLISSMEQSPFNVGERLNLLDFMEGQVHELNQRHGAPLAVQALPTFLDLLGGHPYLTRKALYEMVKHGLPWEDVRRLAATDQGIFDQHLQRLVRSINQAELKSALRTVIRTQRCPDEAALSRLLRAGVIKGSGDHFICRCKLYESYLKSKLI